MRRDGNHWKIDALRGTIGRSRLTADLIVDSGTRTRIDGKVVAQTLDFDDFASARDRARARATEAAIGERVLPGTRIALDRLAKLDVAVRIDAARLLSSGGPSPFTSLHGRAVLDDRRLTLDPLAVGLTAGTMTGTALVDDRGTAPRLTLDLTVKGSTIQALFTPDGTIQGPFAARLRLAGSGDTVRAALAKADGSAGFAVPTGTVRRDYATYLGGDVLGSVGVAVSGGQARVPLRCLVGRFRAANGVLTPDPLVLDNALSRGDGGGRITLSDERLDLVLNGRSKKPGPLVSTAPARVFGTLSQPKIDVRPPRAEARGKTGTLDRIGFFLKKLKTRGKVPGGAVAPNADCGALAAKALR